LLILYAQLQHGKNTFRRPIRPEHNLEKSEGARAACLAFERSVGSLSKVLSGTKSGRRLQETGQSEDIEFCSQLNKFNGVPIFDGRIIGSKKFI
jgi:phosphosulfolactate phosphohydrolase-like enzyme